MNEKKYNKKIMTSFILIIMLIIVVVGASYAYFSATSSTSTQTITTGNMAINFTSGDIIRATNIVPINDNDVNIKSTELPFSITNTGDQNIKIKISLTDITISEELKNVDFRWDYLMQIQIRQYQEEYFQEQQVILI